MQKQAWLRFDPMETAEVEIYDWAAYKVASLPKDAVNAALGVAVWDGKNGDGKVVAPGVYFIIVKGPQSRLAGKLTLMH